jgi:hypothetical protein
MQAPCSTSAKKMVGGKSTFRSLSGCSCEYRQSTKAEFKLAMTLAMSENAPRSRDHSLVPDNAAICRSISCFAGVGSFFEKAREFVAVQLLPVLKRKSLQVHSSENAMFTTKGATAVVSGGRASIFVNSIAPVEAKRCACRKILSAGLGLRTSKPRAFAI